ncbi:hypothetical protein [Streptomyces cavernicola]|uniref:Uncharacterized protein n=1 Tax=Streptomyces cavernicola TaxID=3043613 RepID=A0ABT6SLH4_9ACTN|nr:hypothetical protein [Streptomyces sp. B-S-A6]MDI3408248.1 hypothetical protein [Streptomyces sp. B-S-A6]
MSGLVLPEGSWWDWEVLAWDTDSLRLAADHDLTYHHGLELTFHGPLLVHCPTSFQDPVFRPPAPAELAAVTDQLGERPGVLIPFTAEAGGRARVDCLIAAERVEVIRELVLKWSPSGD